MAENSISQAVSFINDNSTICIGLTAQKMPAVRSDVVAHHFGKSHKNVLRDIAKLRGKCPESFHQLNFEPMFIETQIGNGATRKDRAYLLTRDGFSLLVMGFTGAAAVRWKIRYIEAFNALEAAALENRVELARESGYLQGLDEGRASAAPEVKAAEEKAQRDTARLFWHFGPARKRRLRSAVRYRKMGLGIHDIAKLLDVHNREVSSLLDAAEALDLLPPRRERPARPLQGSLLALDMKGAEA